MGVAKRNLGLILAVLGIVCLGATHPVLGGDEVKQAGRELAEALDSDPNISPAVKAALKRYITAVDQTPRAVQPTEDMKLQFAGRLDAWFNEKEQEAGGGNVIARYNEDGFGLRTTDEQFSLNLSGRVHTGYQALNHDSDDEGRSDTFWVRSARLAATGIIQEFVGFKIEGDFAGHVDGQRATSTVLQDGWVELRHLGKPATLRVGQFKEPFGWEQLRSANRNEFAERSLVSYNLTPGRDVGAMVYGSFCDDSINYALGMFNGTGKNQTDNNSDSDVAGRVWFRPFVNCVEECFACFEGLQIGLNATHGRQKLRNSSDMAFRTAAGTEFLRLENINGGSHVRYGADVQWYCGPFGFMAEWIKSEYKDMRIGNLDNERSITVNGHYVAATYLLTGEEKTEGRVRPEHNFDPANSGWGAWEAVARYGGMEFQGDILRTGEAVSGGTEEANAITLGFNLYFNPMTVLRVNYVNTQFDKAIQIQTGEATQEQAVIGRLNVEF